MRIGGEINKMGEKNEAECLEEVYKVGEVATKLKVDRRTVLRLIEAGDLEAIDVSPTGARRKHYRIRKSILNEFISVVGVHDPGR